MITLHTFGPFMGTPDASPFVLKAMMLLKLAGLGFRERRSVPFGAPYSLLPFIEDDDVKVADSTLIRTHIEKKYGFDFDKALTVEQKALAWTVERMCEDHLYFALVHTRWIDRRIFEEGIGRTMFQPIPAPVRPLVKALVRRGNAKRLQGHGLGRLPAAEIERLAARDLDAVAQILGEKPWLMGDSPCGADATVFGMIAAILVPQLDSPLRSSAQRHPGLGAYCERILGRYFGQH